MKNEKNNSTCIDTNKSYVADFETTTNENDCRVWCFSISEIGNEENTIVGKDITEFFNILETLGNANMYFHNILMNFVVFFHHLAYHSMIYLYLLLCL